MMVNWRPLNTVPTILKTIEYWQIIFQNNVSCQDLSIPTSHHKKTHSKPFERSRDVHARRIVCGFGRPYLNDVAPLGRVHNITWRQAAGYLRGWATQLKNMHSRQIGSFPKLSGYKLQYFLLKFHHLVYCCWTWLFIKNHNFHNITRIETWQVFIKTTPQKNERTSVAE